MTYFPHAGRGYTFPVADGSSKDVLQTDGAGVVGFGPAFSTGGIQLISKVILGSPAASVAFNSIPQIFSTLQMRTNVRLTSGGITSSILAQLNGDTGNNYLYQTVFAVGAAPSQNNSQSYPGLLFGGCPDNSTNAAAVASNIAEIFNYSGTTFRKICFADNSDLRGADGSSNAMVCSVQASLWKNTAAVTDILVINDAGGGVTFDTGSLFALYGVG